MRAVSLCVVSLPWLALLAPGAAQQFAAAAGPLPPPRLEVQVGPGARFVLADGVAWVADAAARRPLPATVPTGRVHELTVVSAGTVVAAADAGLLVADAAHPVLDPADLRDGAPGAAVRSVAADARDRVWWCSATQFGVLDLRWRFGRTFGPADGLPPGPYERVAVAADGRVLLATPQGSFAYRPDLLAPPRPAGGGEPAVLQATVDGSVRLPVQAEMPGGAQLRVRRRHHHLLQPLVDGEVQGLRPGRHVLEVHAFDRDLNRTVVGEYAVVVPMPKAFDPRFLLLGFGLCLGGVFAWRWRAARGRPLGPRLGHAALRTGVLAVVGLQLLAAVLGYGRSWPFVGFTMYTETWHRDDVLYRPRLAGLGADGTRVPLPGGQLGVLQDGYWQMLAEVVYGGDEPARALFAQVANARPAGAPPFVGFVLADGRIRLTADGPVDVAPTVLRQWRQP